jgi:hypothetical protein
MKKLFTVFTIVAAALFAYAALAPVVESQPTGWLSFVLQDPQGVVQFRALDQWGRPVMIGHGTAVPTVANSGVAPMDGEIFAVHAAGSTPDVQVYDLNTTSWLTFANIDQAQTFGAAQTFSAAATFNGDVNLGSDEIDTITVNAPVSNAAGIHRDNFCSFDVLQNDDTAESGTDTEINLIYTDQVPDSGYYQYITATATLSLAQPIATGCGLDVSGDITANDGHEIKFSRTPLLGRGQVITGMATAFYFEISITIADISTFDGDWATGVMLPEAQQNPPQHDGLDTYVIFTLSDNAGDLDVEGDNAGGGETNDDTGITWADGETHVLRIEVADDFTAAYVDGVAITLTNVNVVGEWFDTGDSVLPFYYHTQGAEAAASGVVINYVEWGYGQI